ncbi:MAG: adenylosuccinate lyase [Dehalococcoidia bacterium]
MIERYSRPAMTRIWSDGNKFQQWLAVEKAACRAWAALGEIPADAVEKIDRATIDEEKIAEYLVEMHHDMTAFLRSVADGLGDESRFVHLGLTSSDVMDTATGLQMVASADILLNGLRRLEQALTRRAIEFKDTLIMGRSHGVHAEPMTFGLKLALWVDETRRNIVRMEEARRVIAVGKLSGPVGTHASVPPRVEEIACAELGLGVAPVSNQIVQRDRHAQFVLTLALAGASLEKFALEIRLLQQTELLEAEEPFAAGQTGSSSMPHKRNPEKVERIDGLARVLRGYAVTALENVALWHERDISHSSAERIILPDACGLLDYMLYLLIGIIDGLLVYPDRMRENMALTRGLEFSQRVLLALIDTGLSRQDAYKIVQRTSMRAWAERTSFRNLLLADPGVTDRLSRAEVDGLFDYDYYLRHVDSAFERLGLLAVAET